MPEHIHNLSNAHLDQPSMVTIGVFDGVHIGHQHLIRQVVESAHNNNQLAVVLTFFPHPDILLRGLEGRYYLTSPQQRAEELIKLGVDYVITHPFDAATREIKATDFVDKLLTHLNMKVLRVGSDFALGHKREGDIPFLTEQGRIKGFSVEAIELVQTQNDAHKIISSTLIREALQNAEIDKVRDWLGRGYALRGEVIHGEKRGRQIGFPTANTEIWDKQVIPANGVYAGWAYLGDERFMAMTNVGVSPTFAYKGVTVEAYLLDFNRDIYGQTLTITFEKYLRPEAKFDNLKALIAQINDDVEAGRVFLASLT